MKPNTLIWAMAAAAATVTIACGGGSSTNSATTATTTNGAITASPTVASSTPSALPSVSASAAPAVDFCSRVSAADIVALTGTGGVQLPSELATTLGSLNALATCAYRSAVSLLRVNSITEDHYLIATASNDADNPTGAQPLAALGDEATLWTRDDPPFAVDGSTYTGEATILAKLGGSAVSLQVVTAGAASTIDTTTLTELASVLLQFAPPPTVLTPLPFSPGPTP